MVDSGLSQQRHNHMDCFDVAACFAVRNDSKHQRLCFLIAFHHIYYTPWMARHKLTMRGNAHLQARVCAVQGMTLAVIIEKLDVCIRLQACKISSIQSYDRAPQIITSILG